MLKLQAQLSHHELLLQITQHENFPALLGTMEAEAKRRRIGRDSIHWDSKPEEFDAFEKKALYATGFIQGVEFGVNVLKSIPQQHANIKAEMEDLANQIKESKKR